MKFETLPFSCIAYEKNEDRYREKIAKLKSTYYRDAVCLGISNS